jgi:hypothetical protein
VHRLIENIVLVDAAIFSSSGFIPVFRIKVPYAYISLIFAKSLTYMMKSRGPIMQTPHNEKCES